MDPLKKETNGTVKSSNSHIFEIPKGNKKENEAESRFKGIIAECFPKLMKKINPLI